MTGRATLSELPRMVSTFGERVGEVPSQDRQLLIAGPKVMDCQLLIAGRKVMY